MRQTNLSLFEKVICPNDLISARVYFEYGGNSLPLQFAQFGTHLDSADLQTVEPVLMGSPLASKSLE
jgi:hypothetical protein